MAFSEINISGQLSLSLQKIGRKRYVWFTRFNTVSFASLGESILILYAIKNGADDFLIGLISSLIFLTLPLMPFGKNLIGKIGAARAYGLSWLLRNISAAILIFVPFVAAKFSHEAGLTLLTIASFGFFAFRSIGFTANTPLIGEITDSRNRGAFISQVWLNFTGFYVLSLIALTAVLHRWESLATFQWIILFGVLAGILASLILMNIPESTQPSRSGRQPMLNSLKLLWRESKTQKLLFAWTAAQISLVLMIPFSLVALKNGYGVSDHKALVFIVVQLSGGILVSLINGLILDRVGPRPMIIIYSFSLITNSLLWVFAPATYLPGYLGLIFLLNGLCSAGINSALSHYFLTVVSEKERVNANMVYSMASGLFAGLAGTFLGGGILKLIRNFGLEKMAVYHRFYLMVLVLNILLFWPIRRVERVKDWKIRDVLGIFISFRDIRALFTLSKLTSSYSYRQDVEGVQRLEELPSDLSEKHLLNYLKSPRFFIRARALNALGSINFGEETAKEIIRELKRGKFTTAYIAAEILGEHGVKEAIPELRRALDSDDLYLQGKALVALAQLQDENSYSKICRIFDNSENPRIVLNGGHALAITKNKSYARNILNKLQSKQLPDEIKHELLFNLADLADCEDVIYRFLKSYRDNLKVSQVILVEILEKINHGNNAEISALIESIRKSSWEDFCNCQTAKQLLKIVVNQSDTEILGAVREYLNTENTNLNKPEIIYSLVIIAASEKVTNKMN